MGTLGSKYDRYNDGQHIDKGQRLLYRQRLDLQRAFPNPFRVAGKDCYKAWYDAHPHEHPPTGVVRIAPGTPIAVVFSDLARYFNSLVVAGRGDSRVKRLLLRVAVRSLHLAAKVSGRGKKA